MSLAALDNLVRIGQLKAEARNVAISEYGGFLEVEESDIAELRALVAELVAEAANLLTHNDGGRK